MTELDISNNTLLIELNCLGNKLTVLDVSNNTALKKLSCSHNNLTSLDVRNNTALTELNCYYNNLTALDVSNNMNLSIIRCSDNKLTALHLGENSVLGRLECYNNNLNTLNVSKNSALMVLWCFENKLTELNVSNNTLLTQLFCNNNNITALDISYNTVLTHLVCNCNNLTALDVSNNVVLTELDCSNNNLITVNLTNNAALTMLGCDFPIVYDGSNCIFNFANFMEAYKNSYDVNLFTYCTFHFEDSSEKNLLVSDVVSCPVLTGSTLEYIRINGLQQLIVVYPVNDAHTSVTAPIITTIDIPIGSTDADYSQTFTAYGDTPITWSIASGDLPKGISLDSAGTLSGIPAEDGIFTFSVKASNSAGSDTKLFTLIVPFSEIRHPKITTTALNEGYVNSPYGQKLTATGTSTGLTSLTWSADNLPDGLSLSTTGYLSGTPTSTDSVTVTVYATNAIGTDSADFTLTISEPPAKTKPTITTESPLYPAAVGLDYYCQLTASGTPPFKWSFKGKLPKGLTMTEDGVITGNTSKKLAKVITVTASNDFGTDTKKFTIKSYKLPQITRKYLKDATVGKGYSKSISKKGTAPFTWEFEGRLPQGITSNDKNGKITGKPVINDSGMIRVTLTNPVGELSKVYILKVNAIQKV